MAQASADPAGQARRWWQGISPDRRRLYGIVGAVAVTVAVAAFGLSSYTPYSTVYTNLTPQAAGQVVQALSTLKIPYRLSASGTSVAVPKAAADQARVQLAMQNLPQQGQVGYQNVLTSTSFGMTNQEFNLAVLNALQNDLASTISTMQGIHSATVQIVEPAQSAFALPASGGARASVYIDVTSPGGIGASEVNGIEQLVSHAVTGLTPGHVAVVDQSGQLLSAQTAPVPGGQSANAELAAENAVENTLATRITNLLEPVVGPGNVAVTVHALLSFGQTKTTSTIAKNGSPSSKSSTTETFSGTGTPPTVVGVSGNVPGYTGVGAAGKSKYTVKQNRVSYVVDRIVSQTSSQPMTVQTLTVSLLVNSRAFPLTGARLAQVRALVANAIGLPSTSKLVPQDITVAAAPFAAVPIPLGLPLTQALPLPEEVGGAVLLLLLLFGLAFLLLRRKGSGGAPVPARAPSGGFAGAGATIVVEHAPNQEEAALLAHEEELMQHVNDEARGSPEQIANLLRGWLRDENT